MYQQHHEHQPTQQHSLPQQQQTNGYAPNAAPVAESAPSSAGALDHALLESLFYSEMMFDSTTLSAPSMPTEHDTPHTIVEKEILRDFGVDGTTLFHDPAQSPPEATPAATDTPQYDSGHTNPQNGSASYTTEVLPPQVPPIPQQQQQQQPIHQQQQLHHHQQAAPLHHQAPPPSSAVPQYAHNGSTPAYTVPSGGGITNASAVPPPTTSNPPHPQSVGMPVYMDTQATATAAAAAAAMLGNNGSIKVQPSASIPGVASPNTTRKAASRGAFPNSNPPLTAPMGVSAAPNPQSAAANGIVTQQQRGSNKRPRVEVPEERARQLVDQFATLASRLGIDLPNSVLQSLTSAAAKNDPTLLNEPPQTTTGTTSAIDTTNATTATANSMGSLNSGKQTSFVIRNTLEMSSQHPVSYQ